MQRQELRRNPNFERKPELCKVDSRDGREGLRFKVDKKRRALSGDSNRLSGQTYIDPRLSDSIADLLLGTSGAMCRPDVKRLSGRESQVLREIAIGFTTKAIASKFGVSQNDTDLSCKNLRKIGLHSRADLVHYAIAQGMLGLVENAD